MTAYYNRVKFTTSTIGVGAVTVGSAAPRFRTPVQADVPDGAIITYVIEDGPDWETGEGLVSGSGTIVSRSVRQSTNNNQLLNLSGSAIMRFSFLGEEATAMAGPAVLAPDVPPLVPNAIDDEFDGQALNAKWTQRNIALPSTLTVADGSLILYTAKRSGLRFVGVHQPAPAGNWKIRTLVTVEAATWNYGAAGIVIGRGTKWVGCYYMPGHDEYGTFWVLRFDGDTFHSEANRFNVLHYRIYQEAQWDGTNITWRCSVSGKNSAFFPTWAETGANYLGGAPDKIGIGLHPDFAGNSIENVGDYIFAASFEWFRRIA